ncbi:hypothetical protein IFR04_014149 [Cadophora malorum]|uniref:Uncharacterized protein n=1 Tax=Cadophora malorum TaxID=108018 RepID=A0A8H7T5E6_9HELO|nr:hypothetical protein IFR04_014149 [Cadophora malorum]
MADRVYRSNRNALPVVELLRSHPSVEQDHPSLRPTNPWYEKVKRRDGGPENLLSVVFRRSNFARHFYDSLDLACYCDQDKCGEYGLPKHIICISVGLEDLKNIVRRI